MRKLIAVIVIAIYGVGNILFPNIDMGHLQEMYRHCATEDPDINIPDFVFEHLLNLPDVFEQADDKGDNNEKPHQPVCVVNASPNAILEKPIQFECRNIVFDENNITYPSFKEQNFPCGFTAGILRPPIV